MQREEIKVNHHNRTIDGMFFRPDGKGKFPLIIFSHGYNGYKTDFEISAEYFAENKIGAVCYTFCGGSVRDESGFPTTEMTLFTEKEDLLAMIKEVSSWDWVDENYLFLFGGSQGGMVSALAAEDVTNNIRGLILLYPAFCIADNWRERFPKKEDIPDEQDLWGMMLGRKYFEAVHDFKIQEHIGKFENKVLIMHGMEDEIVPFSYGKWAKDHYKNARLESFANEKHGFSEAGNRRMEAMALYFVRECLMGK